ncbi:MAG: DMT family transporter [Spirochaetaceae bacterium]|jgi:drug/metabolite transporter (DMT)-like permease|nr:DMT family transporter [Spirochaetaceae bacterium]
MQQKVIRFWAAASLVFATVLWGGGFVAVKDSLDFFPPLYLIALRFAIAGVFLGAVFFKRLLKIRRGTFIRGLILSLFLFIAYAFQTIGLQHTTAGKNAFLTTIYVILVPLLGWAFSRRNPGAHIFAAAIIAIAGIGLLSLEGGFFIGIGDVLTLGCGFWFAVHIVFIARFTQGHDDDPIALTILQMLFCALCAGLCALFFEWPFPQDIWHFQPLASLGYLAIFSSGIAFLLQNVGQKYTPAGTAALLLSLESIFGAVFSAVMLGESMSLRMLTGCALLLFAIVLSETKFAFLFKRQGRIKRRG